jgi:hypothetical protein
MSKGLTPAQNGRKNKQMSRYVMLALVFFLIFSVMAIPASAAGTGSFEVGGFWQPPVYVGGDYNTSTNWANIAAANIDAMTGIRAAPSGKTHNKTSNETGIANSYANNVKLFVTDTGITGKPVYTSADISTLQTNLKPYKDDSRVKGINIKDEPFAFEMEGYANAYKRAKAYAPNLEYYVNMLPPQSWGPTVAPPGKLILSNSGAQGDGSYVSSTYSLGQTITIPSGVTFIDGIDMYIDSLQWSSSEVLTLKLWNSTSKTSLLGQASITGNGSGNGWDFYRYFRLNATVTPGSTYYMELTHNGGGDNSVGWVVRSSSSVYSGGAAYENGVSKSYDFFFRLYTTRDNIGTDYENYLDDWIQYSGANYVMYDHYPFRNGYDESNAHFQIAENVRGRGLANNVLYGGYLQSVEIKNSNGDIVFRSPTMDEMRWNVYTFLTYGFKKMHWFTYWRPDSNGGESFNHSAVDYDGTLLTRYSQIQTLSSEMRKLGGTLKDLTSVRVYHTGTLPSGTTAVPGNFFVKPTDLGQPMIIGYFTNASGRKYIMLTNRDYLNARTLNFNFNPRPSGLTEISKTSGSEVSVPGYNAALGDLNITLNPGEGRLFALPDGYSPYANLAAEAKVTATSSYESTRDGWGKNKVNDDQRNSVISKSAGWSSNSNTGVNHTESITFDLGSTKTVNEVGLLPRNDSDNVGQGFPVDFTVQVATSSGGPWTTVVTRTGYAKPGNAAQWFPFASVSARYVKVEGTNLRRITTESGQPYRMQFAEVEIYSSGAPEKLLYRVVSRNSGKVASVTGISMDPGANIAQWPDAGNPDQKWALEPAGDGYYKIRASHSWQVMEVEGSSTADGANVRQNIDINTTNQHWKLISTGDGYYKLQNRRSGKMLDVAGASTADNANIQQWTDNGCYCQRWQLEPIGNVKLISAGSGKALDVANASTANGGNIQQWSDNGCLCQSWQFASLGNGFFKIVNQNSGKVVAIDGGIDANERNILQWDYYDWVEDQKWRIVFNDDGSVQLRPMLNGNRNIDVWGFSTLDGANVQLYDATNTPNQRWFIRLSGH